MRKAVPHIMKLESEARDGEEDGPEKKDKVSDMNTLVDSL